MSLLPLLKVWLWVSVLATVAGWLLSALGQLNRAGYVVFAVVVAGALTIGRLRSGSRAAGKVFNWTATLRRFRRRLPFCFALLALLVFVGGLCYPPSNHTALSYRIPRVLHWLAEGRWHWIHTANYRMNNRACGIEWLSAPLLLFTRSDRALFLLNFVPFLLLPGLIFSVCRRLGVRGRVVWPWMWLVPTGYSFILQAGSAGNDTFATVYALAAVDFGLRAWTSRRLGDLWLSLLAAALLTGAKASNLPLLLPWALLILPLVPLVKQRPALTFVFALVAALVSFLPSALLNVSYCGDWSGLKLERTGMDMKSPLVGVWGNLLLLALNNFVPPFFPAAGWWNQHALSVLPRFLAAPLEANFEPGFQILGELPTEDWVGIGFGVSLLVLASVFASVLLHRARKHSLRPGPSAAGSPADNSAMPPLLRQCVLLAPWAALMAYCMKSGMVTGARLISPYYPLLLPLLLLLPGQALVVRRRWWSWLAPGVALLAFPVLILTPGRPLWPAQTVLSRLAAAHPDSHAFSRARDVYAVYARRSDPLETVRALLPPGLPVVGFMGSEDDIEISLWRPLGERAVEDVLPGDSAEELRQRHVRYIVVGGLNLSLRGVTLSEWLERTGGQLLATTHATVKVAEGPQTWHLVRLPERM